MTGLLQAPKVLQEQFVLRSYGDYDFEKYTVRPGELHGFTYAYVRRGPEYHLFGSLSERPGFTAIRFFARQNRIELARDCEGRVITEPFAALEVVQLRGAEEEVFDLWFALQNVAPPDGKAHHRLHELV